MCHIIDYCLFFLILFLEFKGFFFVKGVFPLNNKKKIFHHVSDCFNQITWWFVNPFYIWCPFYPFISSLNQPMALILYKVSQDTLFWFSSILCFLSSVNFMIILNVSCNFKDHKPKHANHKSMAIYIKIWKNKRFVVVTESQCVIRSLWICLFSPQRYFSVWWLKSGWMI